MVAQLAVAAGIAAVSALAQAYNAAEARHANKREMARIKRLFDQIVPPGYDVSPNDPPEYITERLKGARFDFSNLTPEDYKSIGTYAPEAAPYVAEVNPTLVKGTEASREGRGAQMDALRAYQEIAKGNNPELRARLQEAALASQGQAQARSQSALTDAARRGTLGSGLNFASVLQGNSDSLTQGAAAGRLAAVEAYKAKIGAIGEAGDRGRQLAQDENALEATNAGIINSFNQRTSSAYQAYLNQRAALSNEAQLYNLKSQQEIADKNTASRNQAAQYNLENRNRLAQLEYQNNASERNYQNTLAGSQAAWKASEKERANNLKSKAYQDQLAIANGKAGQAANTIAFNNQNAADRNNAIAGVAQAGAGYFAADAAQEAQKKREADYKDYMERYLQMIGSKKGYRTDYSGSTGEAWS